LFLIIFKTISYLFRYFVSGNKSPFDKQTSGKKDKYADIEEAKFKEIKPDKEEDQPKN
jgi:hypothetical protein